MNTRDPEGEWQLHRITLPFVWAELILIGICLGVALWLDFHNENVLWALVYMLVGTMVLAILGCAVLVYALLTKRLIWNV